MASTTENDLLKMMVTVRDELNRLIDKHDMILASEIASETPVLELGNHKIEAVTFID